jgi:DNA-binding NarL/FixJ family response regulator
MSPAMPDERACRIEAGPAPAPRGLVVEDQVLVGLAIEAYLNDVGIEVGASLRSEGDALRWLARERPDFAIVDYALSDGPCVALAAALRRNGIPFVVYSGHPQRRDMAGPLRGAVWIDKPAPRATMLSALVQILPQLEPVLRHGHWRSEGRERQN